MPLDKKALNEQAIQQIDKLLEDFNTKYGNRRTTHNSTSSYDYRYSLANQEAAAVITRFSSAINRLSPPGSAYRQRANDAISDSEKNRNLYIVAGVLLGILEALRADLTDGYVDTISELIHADLFADFIDMAKYLLEEGYKDPAAVITGSVLEEHLRKLCVKNGLPIESVSPKGNEPLKASKLNDDLKGAGVYDKLEHSSVLSWLHIRNSAAHGKYGDYQEEQVKLMVQGVEAFLLRHPA